MDESNLQNVIKIWKETQGLNNFWACKCKNKNRNHSHKIEMFKFLIAYFDL